MSASSNLYAGVMTGTSLDGLDAVLADFSKPTPAVVGRVSLEYPDALRAEMLALQAGSDGRGLNELHRSQVAAIGLSALHSDALLHLFKQTNVSPLQVSAIGVHGQTVRHAPNGLMPYTVQLISPSRIAEATGCKVISDFRARDIAAGGQGAPLVPGFHAALCNDLAKPIAIVNIGGFANISLLHADGTVHGFDTGPGNVLMDAWTQLHHGKAYDSNGDWAASGQVQIVLLSRLLAHPYFSQALPKSTGREAFGLTWLNRCLEGLRLAPADVQATLCTLTAQTIAQAVETHLLYCQSIYVCGGGAFNAHLMAQLELALNAPVQTTEALGVAPQHMEALAFAWLARQCLLGLPSNVPSVTGAIGLRILGSISPA
jgi:anhydro-N-acetylmuramic acid kinase